MENNVLSRWISDPEHRNKPDWATKKTPKGWSDSKGGSTGSNSFVDIDKRLSEELGFEVKANTEERIPIILGKLSNSQIQALKKASTEDIESLYESCKHSMRIDLVIEAKNKDNFPFPIFVEADGSQHERNGVRNNSSENHLDRVKDFCCRLNKKGLMIRVKSNKESSRKVEFIAKELIRYNDSLPKELLPIEKRQLLQEYADAMCFMLAHNQMGTQISLSKRPREFVKEVQQHIVKKITTNPNRNKGFNPEEIKLLNIWVRDKKDLSRFLFVLKRIEAEKEAITPHKYQGEWCEPYTFIDKIVKVLRQYKNE